MFKKIYIFIAVLVLSTFVATADEIDSRLISMGNQLSEMSQGTPEYTRLQADITKLTKQKEKLDHQNTVVANLQTQYDQADPASTGYAAIKQSLIDAKAARLEIYNEIKIDALAISNRNQAGGASGAVVPTLSGAQVAAGKDAAQYENVQTDTKNALRSAVGNTKLGDVQRFSNSNVAESTDPKQIAINKALEADITMVVVGTITQRLSQCKADPESVAVPDVQTAKVAGQAFVAGEVAEYAQLQSVREQMRIAMSAIHGDPSDTQINSLRVMRDTFKSIRSSMNNKYQIRSRAMGSFHAAAGAAAAQAAHMATANTACSTDLQVLTDRGADVARRWYYPVALACATSWDAGSCATAYHLDHHSNQCRNGGNQSVTLNKNRQIKCEDLNSSYEHIHAVPSTEAVSGGSSISSSITQACLNSGLNIRKNAEDACWDPLFNSTGDGMGPYTNCNVADTLYKKNMISCPKDSLAGVGSFSTGPLSNAAMLSTIGISKQKVVNFINTQSPKFANALDTQLAAPVWRSIAWAGLGDIAGEAIIATGNMIEQVDNDILLLDAIINGTESQLLAGVTGVRVAARPNASVGFSAQAASFAPLASITETGPNVVKGSIAYNELPLGIQAGVNSAIDTGTALNGATSLSTGLMSAITTGNAGNTAIKSEMVKRQEKLQKILGRNGIKLDMPAEIKKFAEKMTGITHEGLVASNMSPREFHSSTDNSDAALPKVSTDPKFKLNFPQIKFPTLAGSSSKPIHNNSSSAPVAMMPIKKADSGFEEPINKANGNSIFELINNRYMKSAYPRLFQKLNE